MAGKHMVGRGRSRGRGHPDAAVRTDYGDVNRTFPGLKACSRLPEIWVTVVSQDGRAYQSDRGNTSVRELLE